MPSGIPEPVVRALHVSSPLCDCCYWQRGVRYSEGGFATVSTRADISSSSQAPGKLIHDAALSIGQYFFGDKNCLWQTSIAYRSERKQMVWLYTINWSKPEATTIRYYGYTSEWSLRIDWLIDGLLTHVRVLKCLVGYNPQLAQFVSRAERTMQVMLGGVVHGARAEPRRHRYRWTGASFSTLAAWLPGWLAYLITTFLIKTLHDQINK